MSPLLDDGLNVTAAGPSRPLEDYTVPELRAKADAAGLDVPSSARKAEIIDALRTAEGAG